MNKLGTIIGFTYKQKAKTKSFKVTTLILVILMSIGMNLPYIISSFTGEDKENSKALADVPAIGLVVTDSEQQAIGDELKLYTDSLVNPAFRLISYDSADESMLNSDVSEGAIDGYMTLQNVEGSKAPLATFYSEDGNVSAEVITWLQLAIQNAKTKVIAQDSLSEQQIIDISSPVSIEMKEISTQSGSGVNTSADDSANQGINYAFVYILMILFFFSTVMTGNMIASEITAEKSSRIMEILITSVSPLTQMFGKIIGIFLLSLTQIAIFGATIFVNLMLPHNKEMLGSMNIDLSLLNLDVLIYGLIFYIFGYFLYAVLFAAIGSIVSRTEDLGQALTPMTMLSLAAFYIGIFSMSTPNSLLVKISSFVPFTSPTVMILRVGMGEIAVWQIWVSLVILIASILGFGWLSAKIYRTGVLMYGKRPSVAELRKAMKAFKM